MSINLKIPDIRELKPQVVLTFDPIGGYHHPDHIAIQRATTLAFERAADPGFAPQSGEAWQPLALYYHTIPKGLLKIAVRFLPLFGRAGSHDLLEVDLELHRGRQQQNPCRVKR